MVSTTTTNKKVIANKMTPASNNKALFIDLLLMFSCLQV